MRVVDINFGNILWDEKSYKNSTENTLISDILYKSFIGAKPLRIWFGKTDGFIKIYAGIRYSYYWVLNDMMQFIIGLDNLKVKNVVLQILLIIILQESELVLDI